MMSQEAEWAADARDRLIRLVVHGRGWDYAGEGIPRTEPTALACLALRAANRDVPAEAECAARWLAALQQPNGAVGIGDGLEAPEWPTSYAALAWGGSKEHLRAAAKACGWLLSQHGSTFKDDAKILGHDTTIAGWTWSNGAHSWIEPTAMAVLALRRYGFVRHYRVREGLRLIRNRAIQTGGWNYGNNAVYGTCLRPQPAATGMALAALSGTQTVDPVVSAACDYLEDVAVSSRAPQSLFWALTGLSAWGRRPGSSDEWLRRAYECVVRRGAKAPQLASLLLAAGEYTAGLLGIAACAGEAGA
jgi:hypothetical protein